MKFISFFFYLNAGAITAMVTAHFDTSGLKSLEYVTDDPSNFGNVAFVNGEQEPQIIKEDNGLEYYTCPKILYYSQSNTYEEKQNNTTVFYRAFSVKQTDNMDTAFSLLELENYNGIMAIKKLPDHYNQVIEIEKPLDPLTCSFTKVVGNDSRTITITYHNKNDVSASYNGLVVNGNVVNTNTNFIKQSEYFKNWQCPPENEVYAYIDENNTLIISYNKSDLGDNLDIFKYEGNNGNSSNNTPNSGTEVTGCDVVPDVIRKWIKIALNFVKYVSLILVIVLGTLDFIKAAGSGEADSMKKAGQAFLKRVVAVILLFLLPMLVELILDLINLYGSTGDCFGVLEGSLSNSVGRQ